MRLDELQLDDGYRDVDKSRNNIPTLVALIMHVLGGLSSSDVAVEAVLELSHLVQPHPLLHQSYDTVEPSTHLPIAIQFDSK